VSGPARGRGVRVRGLGPFFSRPSGGAGGAYIGAIDQPKVPVDFALLVESNPQGLQDTIKQTFATPAVEAMIDALPFSVTFGHIAPRCSGAKNPEHAVERGAVVIPFPAAFLRGKQAFEQVPFVIREFIARHASSVWRTS